MFQRDHTQNCQYFCGEGGETSAKQRFLTQLFSAKSRAEISPDGENRVGRRSEQATDFFKEKIGAATTAKPRRGGAPEKACFFGEKEAKRPQSRRFSPNSFWPKAGPKFRLTAKTELGEGRSSDDCKATKGRGPRKSLLFWGEGGMTERMRKARPKPGFQAVEKPSIL